MLVAVSLLLYPALLMGQGSGLTNEDLLKPLKDSWPTYNGDYTGRRYSALTQVNRTTVKQLTLGWMSHLTAGADLPRPTGGGQRRGAPDPVPSIVGGEGPGDISIRADSIKGSVLPGGRHAVCHHVRQRLGHN
jgi:alcohol dehydrogenase (cytochrome c)